MRETQLSSRSKYSGGPYVLAGGAPCAATALRPLAVRLQWICSHLSDCEVEIPAQIGWRLLGRPHTAAAWRNGAGRARRHGGCEVPPRPKVGKPLQLPRCHLPQESLVIATRRLGAHRPGQMLVVMVADGAGELHRHPLQLSALEACG